MIKKIGLILTSCSWGGLEMNVLKLAKLLDSQNCEVHLFLIKNSRIDQEFKESKPLVHYITFRRKYFDILGAFKFSRLLQEPSILNLLVFDNKDLDFVFFAKLFLRNRLNIIYQQHMQIGISKRDLLHTIRYSAINYWLTPLESLKTEIANKTRVDLSKVRVVPIGTDIHRFISNKYNKSDARKKLKLKHSSFIIGIIGRIDPKKGQLFLVKSIRELKVKYPKIELLIVGEPTYNDSICDEYFIQINDYINNYNLSDFIHLLGFTSDVNLFYNAIDLFALASENETYGMVTIESLLSGIPVIATNSAGTPELLNYGEYGYLYKPFDMESFSNVLSEMIENYKLSTFKARNGRLQAINKYSQNIECARVLEFIV